jgi:YfiR/HmsC-like
MRFAIRIGAIAIVIAAGIAASVPARSAPPATAPAPIDEYLVKAAFLYNFAKLTDWPASKKTGGRFLLCVLGDDPFARGLDAIAGKTVNDKVVAVFRGVELAQAQQCHLVFIAESESARLRQHLEGLRDRPVLTVSDLPNFAHAGGMIALKVVENRVRFAVNVAAGQRAGLTFSSRLLHLAEIVSPASGGAPAAGGPATGMARP